MQVVKSVTVDTKYLLAISSFNLQLRKQEGPRFPPMQGPHHTSKGIGQDTKSLSPPAAFSFLRPTECNSTVPLGIQVDPIPRKGSLLFETKSAADASSEMH